MTTSFWRVLDLDNLTGLEKLVISQCPPLLLDGLRKLSSTIKVLYISDENRVISGKELTQVLCCLPKLSELKIYRCEKITGLGVIEQLEEEIDEGLLLLPPQLQELVIWQCPQLSLRGKNGGGLQVLSSFRSLEFQHCPKFLACYSSSPSSSCFPFSTCLQYLMLGYVETLAPLSNLASLTQLRLHGCGGFEGAGLQRLLAHGCLRELSVYLTPNFFSTECCSEDTPEMLEHEPTSPSSKLQSLTLNTDDVAGVLAAPICRLLSSSLIRLHLEPNEEMERFTKEQDEALQLLTSLQELNLLIGWDELQCLPAGLQRLTNLNTLRIPGSPAIHSLHKDGLPGSLQELEICGGDIQSLPKDSLPNSLRKLTIFDCSSIRSLPKDGLPNSLQELEISHCPSIRALPKDGLPSSLKVLNVRNGNSEELTKQCRKLIGIIPIVRV